VQYQEEGFGHGFGGGPFFNGRGLNLPNGVTVAIGINSVVSGGPADKAGIKAGDVISKLNGTAVTTSDAFVQAIGAMKVGDTVTLTVYHQGSQTSTDIQVILGDNPQSAGKPYLGVSLFGIDTTQKQNNGANGNGGSSNFQSPFRGRPFQTQPTVPSGTGA
jgi:PDZ domain-containing secreted protein